jgi:type I restriction enzyme S subunit
MNDLPIGWSVAEIADLFATLEDGRTLHQGWSPQCELVPSQTHSEWGVLKTTAIQPARFMPEHNKRLPPHLAPRPQIEVRTGDILITCAGPRARCGISCLIRNTRPRLMMSGKMYRFRLPEQHVSARYVEYYLQSAEATLAIDRMKTGGSDSGLNLTHDRFRQLVVPLAPRPEQERIVAAIEEEFSRLDAGMMALERIRKNLKRMRMAVLEAAVAAGDAAVNERVRLGDVLREPLRNGYSAKADGAGSVRIWTLTAVTNGDFGLHNSKLTSADPKRVRDLWVQPGDLLIERSNTPELVGTARLYTGQPDVAVYPDLMIRARVSESVLPQFAELMLLAPPARRYFQRRAQGISGSMPKIDQAAIEGFTFPLPSLESQAEILESAASQLSLIEMLEGSVATASIRCAHLRSSTLATAFSGKLLPQCATDEPASVLLERIAVERPFSNGHKPTNARKRPATRPMVPA